ncbi:MAG: DUF6316 family protein [Pseudomonadota bacterium]
MESAVSAFDQSVSVIGQAASGQSGDISTRSKEVEGRQNKGQRKYEAPRQWCRTSRVYCAPDRSDAWYFQTREGIDVGPYLSQFSAEVEASLLKEHLGQESCQNQRRAKIRAFMQESLELSAHQK